jgi:hypothetical protein
VSNIAPGIAELILVGNADAQGNPVAINLSGSTMDINAFTTVGASYGHSLSLASNAHVGIGITAKYTVGHFLARSQESEGDATTNPIGVNLQFPTIHSAFGDDPSDGDEFDPNGGSGFGLDIGASYQKDRLTLAAAVQNVINTFEWDETMLRYRPATFTFNGDVRESEFESQPVGTAPAALRESVADMKFKPSVTLGASLQANSRLMVGADARFGGTAGMSTRPQTQVGAGVEFRLASFLPIRLGAAFVKIDENNSGTQFGGGLGLEFGAINISAGALRRSTDLGVDNMFMLTLLSFGM